jgi:hypothetical protein
VTIIEQGLYKAEDFEWYPGATLLAATQSVSSKVSAAHIICILNTGIIAHHFSVKTTENTLMKCSILIIYIKLMRIFIKQYSGHQISESEMGRA